jgi:bacillithiol system protein YtxJ
MSNRKVATTPALHELHDATALDEALGSERAILYKHSTRCPVSAVVLNEVLRFDEAHPDWTTYLLKVIEQRQLSDTVAERLGVSHESPQVFVIKQGQCVWHTSHHLITSQALSQQVVAS